MRGKTPSIELRKIRETLNKVETYWLSQNKNANLDKYFFEIDKKT